MDVTFTTDSNGNPLLVSGSKEISNIIYQLFHMRKGDSKINMDAGLDIMSKQYCVDTDLLDYPQEISDQISKYTDYTASDISATIVDGNVVVAFSLITQTDTFSVVVGIKDSSLNILLEKQV